MADNKYSIDYGTRVAGCKKCKQKIEKGQLRIAKITASPFSDDGEMKLYHHPACIFETFKRARATTKIIEDPGDLDGWENVKDDDKEEVKKLIRENKRDGSGGAGGKKAPAKKATPPAKAKADSAAVKRPASASSSPGGKDSDASTGSTPPKVQRKSPKGDPKHKDNSFKEFRRICANVSNEAKYTTKTDIIKHFFNKGTDGKAFKGDLEVWVRLLLPGVIKRIYNIQSKQIIKIFSRIFGASEEKMLEDLEAGDVAETVAKFFDGNKKVDIASKAALTVHDVDEFLDNMTGLTREDEQQRELTKMTKRCTVNDLKMVIRLIKADLKIQAGAKHILDGLHKDAHDAFNSSRNIQKVTERIIELRENGTPNGPLEVGVSLMHPVQPMLALACKSVDMAFSKCPNGMYSEIKYDGERVQLHKKGDDFKFYSRSLKPVLPHKVNLFKEFIPKAFPDGSDLILDAEVLMVDNNTGEPLPFGTLGKHKAAGFKDATPCLFVFDCIYYNGESLMNKPIKERRRLLEKHMKEVGNHVKFSEMELITKKSQLGDMIKNVLKQGLEGLVLKDLKSPYEPGKRHWLKVKKDYLNEGAMADSADLVVLGGWYGTGNRGGIISIFLMGCYDERVKRWRTVTKVHTGLDDKTLDDMQGRLNPNMTKIKQDYDSVPDWLDCTRQMTPDFVAKDPKKSLVWEITGAEFTKSDIHTAGGISIRFPRITKQREDKTWETATSLTELEHLFKASKEAVDYDIEYSTSSPSSSSNSAKPSKVKKEEVEEDFKIEAASDDEENHSPKSSPAKKSAKKANTGGGKHSYNKTHIESEYGLVMNVIKGDLFKADANVSLAHCISKDYRLGKGIAKLFREKFGRIDELQRSGADIGGVATLKVGSRCVYNLVTKAKYSDKPTYESLRQSLEAMREHAGKNGVKEIAMPKIGCGLDGLQWNAVRTLVKNVFLKDSITLTVYTLDDDPATAAAEEPTHKYYSPSKNPKPEDTTKSPKKEAQPSVKDAFAKMSKAGGKRKSADEADEREPKKGKVLTELPNVFDDVKVLLMKGVQTPDRLKRYVIAFGGEVLESYQASDATHIIYPKSGAKGGKKAGDAGESAVHVYEDWLVQSIKKKLLLKCEPHMI